MLVQDSTLLRQALADRDYLAVKQLLQDQPPASVAALLAELPAHQRAVAFRLLDKSQAIQVFESMEAADRHELLDLLHDEQVVQLVEEMSPDDRVRLLDELPAKVAKRLLQRLSPEEREATAVLLGYPAGTAGRIMTPEFVSLRGSLTAAEALEKVRRSGLDKETIYTIYVTEDDRRLVGVLSLRNLVMADPGVRVADIMQRRVISVTTSTDQEQVARLMQEHDLLAVPVVDSENRLVGIITVDDVMDIIQQEASEDIHRLAGIAPLPAPREERYFDLNLFGRLARRMPWLAVLAVIDTISGGLLAAFEDVLSAAVTLAFFIPMIMDTAGNTGAQMVTLVVRALATGELKGRRFVWVALQEVATGLALGAVLGLFAAALTWARTQDLRLAGAVGAAMVSTVVVAGLLGAVMPFLFRSLRIDPAVASGPLITTLGDVAGLFIYFSVARLLYGVGV